MAFSHDISTTKLIKRFWFKALPTWLLVVMEGISLLLFPMVIGWAIDGLVNNSLSGVYKMGFLSITLLAIGSARRFYDTRTYAKIYKLEAEKLVYRELSADSNVSKVTARVNLFTEFIYFLEDSIPNILQQLINLFGTLAIILFITKSVFLACLAAIVLTFVVYGLSQKKIMHMNKEGNDEYENQVNVFGSKEPAAIKNHFAAMMKWRVKLSDLETINFSIIWIMLSAVLLFSVFMITKSSNITYGKILSTVMYVFGFVESILVFPFFFQEIVRLQEIGKRLEG